MPWPSIIGRRTISKREDGACWALQRSGRPKAGTKIPIQMNQKNRFPFTSHGTVKAPNHTTPAGYRSTTVIARFLDEPRDESFTGLDALFTPRLVGLDHVFVVDHIFFRNPKMG